MMKRLDRTEIIFKITSYILLTLFAVACLYPFIFVLANSISTREATDAGTIYLWPDSFNVNKI